MVSKKLKKYFEEIESELRENQGNYLAWSIIHLIFFIYMIFNDFGYSNFSGKLTLIILTGFFGWRFIDNTISFFRLIGMNKR